MRKLVLIVLVALQTWKRARRRPGAGPTRASRPRGFWRRAVARQGAERGRRIRGERRVPLRAQVGQHERGPGYFLVRAVR